MTSKPGPCIAANKSVFQQSVDATIEQCVDNEIAVFVRFMTEEPYGKEGYAAYREGREPFWKKEALHDRSLTSQRSMDR